MPTHDLATVWSTELSVSHPSPAAATPYLSGAHLLSLQSPVYVNTLYAFRGAGGNLPYMVMRTLAEIKAAFHGTPDKKAGYQSKTKEINAQFQLDLPLDGTIATLKLGLKDAEAELLRKV